MHVVLLTNKSKELLTLNVGDQSTTIKRAEVVQTTRGSVGTRHTEHKVSGSITLLPGERKRVPGIILKQRAVQRLLDQRKLSVVEQKAEAGEEPKVAPVTIEASAPTTNAKGSHPVEEEGTVKVAEVLKARKAPKKAKASKGTEG